MAYRSLKRVLSETTLERKCRLLFGSCLFFLIFIGFILLDQIAVDQIKKTELQVHESARQQGEAYVDMSMLKLHFTKIPDTTTAGHNENAGADQQVAQQKQWQKFLENVARYLDNQDYHAQILTYESTSPYHATPTDAWELKILRDLEKKKLAAAEAHASGEPPPAPSDPSAPLEPNLFARGSEEPTVYYHQKFKERGEYHYYQPVYWKSQCFVCHELDSIGVVGAAEQGLSAEPYRVVKVVLPMQEAETALSKIRAILLAVGIGYWFLAMFFLYVIVRFVVVKPLQHLTQVSDEITSGKTELRAHIETSDEFETLALAFNRMLRHLTDAQTDLHAVNESLDAKVDELAQLNMRLYEMNRLKDDFLANMSHELRTPLNSIIGFSEVLQDVDSLNDKQRRYAQNIQKSGRVLLEMINDILDLAKIEAGKMELRPSTFRAHAVVQAHCDVVRTLADRKNIDLRVEVSEDEPPMLQDQAKVQQILTNLLSNAIKFTPDGGRIVVAAHRNARGWLELTVTDTGVGIAEEDREVIFEKFRQSEVVLGEDGLTREYSGTGLGLSIVKELCKLMGGEISVTSRLGQGSTFRVTLPWELRHEHAETSDLHTKLTALTRPTLDSVREEIVSRREQESSDGGADRDSRSETTTPAGETSTAPVASVAPVDDNGKTAEGDADSQSAPSQVEASR
ncbi:MAG: ATP-binding protein [Pirellulaceae bacterium]|jgi:signal transduction histidine kinase|nr:ATP-binding protein [Pirellulaceae bacterium]MDP7019782.1 ATP-binding protein [Pirellulaceae bacterium]